MKWECLAIILGTPLKEEWVSTFRILLVFLSAQRGVACVAPGWNKCVFVLFA